MSGRPPRLWPVVAAVQLGVLLAALEATIVGTALPTIVRTLGGVHLYPWAFSAYMLASTVVMPVFGALSDRVGRKGPFVTGVAVFGLGALVAGAAPAMPVLIAGRVCQGIGAGGILALSLIIFGDLFAGPRRGQMQALITAVWGFASLVGPLVGGVIVDHWSWRWVFYLNAPLGVVVILLVLLALPETAPGVPGRRLDLWGGITFVSGVTALLVVFLQPVPPGPATEAGLLRGERGIALLVALVALGAFVRIERGARDPLLPLDLFREPAFAAGTAAAFFSGAAMFGALVHVPLLVQWGRGTDATTAGLALMTMSTGWSAGGLVAGQVLHRAGFWGLTVGGMGLMTAGYGVLASAPDASWARLLTVGGTIGIGMGLTSITLLVAIQTLVGRERRGVATSGILFFRNVGATLGVALMGALLTARLGVRLDGLGAGARVLPAGLAEALVDAMGAAFWLGAGAALCGFGATWFLPRRSSTSAATPAGEVAG